MVRPPLSRPRRTAVLPCISSVASFPGALACLVLLHLLWVHILGGSSLPSSFSTSSAFLDKGGFYNGLLVGLTENQNEEDGETESPGQQRRHPSGALPQQSIPKPENDVRKNKDKIVAHAVSLIKCTAGKTHKFMDALVTLRHSIHLSSVHHAPSNSTYSYQMYAFVHAKGCGHDPALSGFLRRLGYIPKVVANPVEVEKEVPDGWYKSHVEGENCCGSDEFVKLHAYGLTDHPVVVHWDLDVLVLRPMDDLFDALLHPPGSPVGSAARSRLMIQRPAFQRMPKVIDAFFTRDVTSAAPWEPIQPVQGGFLVTRPSLEHLETFKELIRSGNFTRGRGPGSGWGGMGYGGFQGAMAYQGVLSFFYDVLYPDHHVELDVCRWNQVVADVIWRGPGMGPGGADHMHECRDYPRYTRNHTTNTVEHGACEDCRALSVDETMTVHYTACKKPWECSIPKPRVPRDKKHVYRLQHLTNVTTCSLLVRRYFEVRRDIEARIATASGIPAMKYDGMFHRDWFLGYCKFQGGYQSMEPLPEGFDMKQVYGF